MYGVSIFSAFSCSYVWIHKRSDQEKTKILGSLMKGGIPRNTSGAEEEREDSWDIRLLYLPSKALVPYRLLNRVDRHCMHVGVIKNIGRIKYYAQ